VDARFGEAAPAHPPDRWRDRPERCEAASEQCDSHVGGVSVGVAARSVLTVGRKANAKDAARAGAAAGAAISTPTWSPIRNGEGGEQSGALIAVPAHLRLGYLQPA